eukprot:gnl/Chilomastix_cuspidata/1162.p1 GENE.gnl/Chilomastix_cuspidata/1162~~gnl/Chilomastix_cuspidata/1162.p1  ORF type:complete len:260 (-),score=106.31 gnl/Chilomastix_cuspidata/1162:417-1196(-)
MKGDKTPTFDEETESRALLVIKTEVAKAPEGEYTVRKVGSLLKKANINLNGTSVNFLRRHPDVFHLTGTQANKVVILVNKDHESEALPPRFEENLTELLNAAFRISENATIPVATIRSCISTCGKAPSLTKLTHTISQLREFNVFNIEGETHVILKEREFKDINVLVHSINHFSARYISSILKTKRLPSRIVLSATAYKFLAGKTEFVATLIYALSFYVHVGGLLFVEGHSEPSAPLPGRFFALVRLHEILGDRRVVTF